MGHEGGRGWRCHRKELCQDFLQERLQYRSPPSWNRTRRRNRLRKEIGSPLISQQGQLWSYRKGSAFLQDPSLIFMHDILKAGGLVEYLKKR